MQRSKATIVGQHRALVPTGRWLFHPSWHVCIYRRMFEGENKILAKEGVTHFLELYEVKSLPYSPELSEVTAWDSQRVLKGPLSPALCAGSGKKLGCAGAGNVHVSSSGSYRVDELTSKR